MTLGSLAVSLLVVVAGGEAARRLRHIVRDNKPESNWALDQFNRRNKR